MSKYDKKVVGAKDNGEIDVYAVLETFNVTCPAIQHAVKKLLFPGLRGKGDTIQDLKEAHLSVIRAISLEFERQRNRESEEVKNHD